jgi:hypothetical protein
MHSVFNILIGYALLFLNNTYQSYAHSVNSGCLSHDIGITQFCENIGCSQQLGNNQYDPTIINYSYNNTNTIDYICSQTVLTNEGLAEKNNVAYSNNNDVFFIPNININKKQYWYGNLFEISSNTIDLTFANIDTLTNNDTVIILRQDDSIYCGFYVEELIENHLYHIKGDISTQKYRLIAFINFIHQQSFPSCISMDNVNSHIFERTHINIYNYTILNPTSSLRRNIHVKTFEIGSTKHFYSRVIGGLV